MYIIIIVSLRSKPTASHEIFRPEDPDSRLFYPIDIRTLKTELTSKSCSHGLFHSAEVRFYKTELTSKILQWHDLRACPRPVCTEACKERSGGK